ncbi:MAG: D-alanyl-D-alanine carboxypeptidase/D-alanyl-D-alanine-endopeptidase [Gammaproteobacteria bacterium]|nr:D-alanyl-D-alanine carboxypeptidase/D-alanyl-D-alanine-endopeptidase [Gammaproteobacteria bacterium]
MLLGPGLPARGQSQSTLPVSVNRILVQHKLPEDSFSAFVQRVGEKEPLLSFNAHVARNPASVIKLLTTFAALETLGPTYQWRTEAYADGRIEGGTLTGDLLLKGYGDPYLVTERLWLLQRELRTRGLRVIDGNLVIDNSWFAREELDPGAFDGQPYRAYNALPDALLVNFQAVNYTFRPDGARGRVEILADPVLANVEVRNNMRLFSGGCNSSKSGISMVVGSEPSRPRVTFSGALASRCAEYQLLRSVLDGPSFAYGAFRGLWEEQGGRLTGGFRQGQVPNGKSPLLTFQSPPLAEVIRPVNKFSNNVMTRQIFLTMGAETFGPPGTLDKGRQAVQAALARRGLDFPELQTGNGAGLARETRISAASLGRLLLAAHASSFQPEFQASFSLAGLDGTTRRRFLKDPAAGEMHLKTGSLNGVTAIAGYVHSEAGADYVVVVIVNHAKATWGGGQEAQNALLRWAYQR